MCTFVSGLPPGNPKCNGKQLSTYTYNEECCTVQNPCGLGEGDCDKDTECSKDLVCKTKSCGVEIPSSRADCCQIKGNDILSWGPLNLYHII